MRTNRLSRHAAALAALAALGALALLAGCGGGSSSSGSASNSSASYLAAVTRAADATDAVPGYKIAMTTTVTRGGKSVTAQGEGAVDDRGSEGTMTLEVEGQKLTELIDKPYVYLQFPSGASTRLTHGKPWVRIDVDTFTQSYDDQSSLSGGGQDPSQMLAYLKSAGTVTRVGSDSVRGVSSTHYHAIVELDRLGATARPSERAAAEHAAALVERITGAKTMPMDVWVGDDGHVSRISYAFSICTSGGRMNDSLSMDLYDYGRQPVVSPPPASEVADVDPLLKAEVAKGLAQLSCK